MSKHANSKGRVSRGTFLKGIGAALVLVAGGGVWRAEEQGVFEAGGGPTYEPWQTWRTDGSGGPLALVPAAILAANPHNTQPWLFRVGGSRLDLFADQQRNIGAFDPFLREMHIGLGCALENLLLAAGAGGYSHHLTLMPDGPDSAHVARIDLSAGRREASEPYEAIPRRHTNRYAYDTERPLSAETLSALSALGKDDPEVEVSWFAADEPRRRAGKLIVEATEAITADEEQSRDSYAWLRYDRHEVRRHRDGLIVDAFLEPGFARAAAKMLPPPSRDENDDSWLTGTKTQVATAAAFGTLAVRDDRDNAQRMRAGVLWQRMHLWAVAHGLAMHPMNQVHERADREAQLETEPTFGEALRGLIGDPEWRGIFSFRAGYPTAEAPASPRRAVEDVLM